MGVLGQDLDVSVKPLPSARGTCHSALSIALTARLDPNDAVDKSVVAGAGARGRAEASRLDIAPLAPLLARAGKCDTALVNDEPCGETLDLEVLG
jgi:hypothetical protein